MMTDIARFRIHPDGLAAMNQERVGQKYRPSNGTEGDFFHDAWCRNCQRDRAMREGIDVFDCDDDEKCEILGMTFALDVDDPEYPSEWQYAKDGQPCCTAFVEKGIPIPEPRCKHTLDMFGESSGKPETTPHPSADAGQDKGE